MIYLNHKSVEHKTMLQIGMFYCSRAAYIFMTLGLALNGLNNLINLYHTKISNLIVVNALC